jgi:hypothetical protein
MTTGEMREEEVEREEENEDNYKLQREDLGMRRRKKR